jgi:hypothetical protein
MPETDDNQFLRGFTERQSDATEELTLVVLIILARKATAVCS